MVQDVGIEDTDRRRVRIRHIVYTKVKEVDQYKRLARVPSGEEQKVESKSFEELSCLVILLNGYDKSCPAPICSSRNRM